MILFKVFFYLNEGCTSTWYTKLNSSVACGIKIEQLKSQNDAKLSCQQFRASLPDIRSKEENTYYTMMIRVCNEKRAIAFITIIMYINNANFRSLAGLEFIWMCLELIPTGTATLLLYQGEPHSHIQM